MSLEFGATLDDEGFGLVLEEELLGVEEVDLENMFG